MRSWHKGPLFSYRYAGKKVAVNVVGSSWPISGVRTAKAVCDVLDEFKIKRPNGYKVLDFGAGSWLRYVPEVLLRLSQLEVHAVEFDEAFHGGAAMSKQQFQNDVTFWTPKSFVEERELTFDLILLINVFNTMPEEVHRRKLFKCLSQRLNPLGWLVVYQRKWDKSENPPGALPYGDGWLIPQPDYDYYTYRAKTGATWFNAQAAKCELRLAETETVITSSNTLLRVWEKKF
jgi:SAM-dependent methyltransferase